MDSADRGASGKSKKPDNGKARRKPPVLDLKATELTSGRPQDRGKATEAEQSGTPGPVEEPGQPEAAEPVTAGTGVASATATMPPEYPGAPAPDAAALEADAQASGTVPPSTAEPTAAAAPEASSATAATGEPEAIAPAHAEGQRTADPVVPPVKPSPRPRRWPAVLGGMIAGSLGGAAAAALLLYAAGLLPFRPDRAASDAMRLSALESQMRSVTSAPPGASPARLDELAAEAAAGRQALESLKDMEGRLAKLEAAPQPPVPSTAPTAGGAESATGLAALKDEVAALRRRLDETAAAVQARGAAPPQSPAAEAANDAGAIESLGRRIAALEAARQSLHDSVQALRGELQGATQQLRGELASTAQELRAEVAAVAQTLRGELASLRRPDDDRPARLATAAVALQQAAERGEPFAAELSAAKALLDDPRRIAALEPFAATGIPPAASLARELVGLLDEQRRRLEAAPRDHDGGLLERLRQSASKLVTVRPANAPPAPSDPTGALAAAASRGDIGGALVQAEKLPDPARAPFAPWIEKAKAREAALAAARQLAREGVAALGANPTAPR